MAEELDIGRNIKQNKAFKDKIACNSFTSTPGVT